MMERGRPAYILLGIVISMLFNAVSVFSMGGDIHDWTAACTGTSVLTPLMLLFLFRMADGVYPSHRSVSR